MEHALGLCSTRAAGLKSQFGTMGKPYNAGIAAATGVEAALLAADGLISAPDAIETEQGFGATHAGQDNMEAFDGLGNDWRFETVSHKFHACCHGTHAALEALAELRGTLRLPEVEAVEIATHPRWLTVCNIEMPQTGLEAKFSFRMTAAMSLSGVDTSAVRSFSDGACGDTDLVKLRDKVRILADGNLPETAARVRVNYAGRWIEAEHDLLGPMTQEVRSEKLRAKARALLGTARAMALWDAVAGPDIELLTIEIGRN